MTPITLAALAPTEPGQCWICRCTDDHACDEGCSWLDAEHTVCSACFAAFFRRELARHSARGGMTSISLPRVFGDYLIERSRENAARLREAARYFADRRGVLIEFTPRNFRISHAFER